MLKIKENTAPDLKTCLMNCDNFLNNKLNDYELTKFLNKHSTTLLIGAPASGKTSLLYSFFKSPKILKKVFNKIYVFQPASSRASMKDAIFSKLPDDQLYEELTYENLDSLISILKNEEPDYNNCIIFDDMGAFLKNKDTLNLLKQLIFNRRHLHTSVFFLVQSWNSVPKDIRKLFNNIFVFKVNKCEMETIHEEVLEIDKNLISPLCNLVFDKKYNFLFINTESQRFFKNFNEILIEEK